MDIWTRDIGVDTKKQADSLFEDSDRGRENGETFKVAAAQVNNIVF